MLTPRLRTQRLELFPLAPEAAAALPADRATAARIIGAALPASWPQPDVLDLLPAQAARSEDEARFGIWVIVEQNPSLAVGDTGFFGPPDEDGTLEIGYSIVPERRRRGYVTEAVAALLAWALEQSGVQVIVAGCEPSNRPSIRTLERLGFVRTGQVGDEIRWRLR